MIYSDLVKLEYGIAIIDLDGYKCVITNKLNTQDLNLETGDILDIRGLGALKIVGIMRKPYRNIEGEQVQEVKFICKEV